VAKARLLLLDLDGTLVDSFDDIRYGIRCAMRAIGIEPTDHHMWLCRRGISLELFYREATGLAWDAPGQAERFDAFVGTYRREYATHQTNTQPFDGVADTLARLRREHADLFVAVTTAKRTDMAKAVVAQTGLESLLDEVCGSDGLPHKPDPAVLQRAANAAGIELSGATMVGDTDKDVGAARAAGCRSCAVTYGGWTRVELEELGDAGPHHLFDRFDELLALY